MSIRNIFSRSTGSPNRRNASRKTARRQALRKRLLGHESLEDRRLLAFDVLQGVGADLGVFDGGGEANDLVISNGGVAPGGPVNITDTLTDYSGIAGAADLNFVGGTAAGVVPGSVDYSTTMPGPLTSIFVDSGPAGTDDDDTVTVNANIGDIGITSVLMIDGEASTGDHAVIDADGNPVDIGAGGIVVNGVTIGIDASFESVEIIGASGGITLTGTAGDETLTLSGAPGAGIIDFGGIPIQIGDAALTLNGEDGSDELIVDFSAGNPIPAGGITLNGGFGPGSDSISLVGGTVGDTTYEFDSLTDGSIDIDGSLIEYTGLDPVVDALTATTRTFTFLGGAETITLDDDAAAADGMSEIDSTAGEIVTFLNPTGTLTINSGDGIDDVNIDGLDSLGAPSTLVVNTGTEDDDLTIATGLGAIGVTTVTVDGDAGAADVLNIPTAGAAVVIDAAGGITVAGEPTITSSAFETINLTGASSVTVEGTAGDDTFEIDFLADSMGSIDLGATRIHFGGSPLTINADAGADTLVVDNTGAGNAINAITFNGEADADSIRLEGAAGTVTHTFTNENDGTILVDAGLITYTGLEPIADNMVAAARIFTFTTTGITGSLTTSPAIPASGVAPATHTRIDSGASELVDFVTPTVSLEINLATGASNTFSVNGLAEDYSTPTNDINLGDSGDTINMEVTGGLGVLSDQDWDVNGGAGNDTLNLSPLAMDLGGAGGAVNALFDGVDFFGGGGATDTINVDDSANAVGGLTYTVTSTSIDQDSNFGEDSVPPVGLTYDAAVEVVNLMTSPNADTIDVTSTSATATTTIVANGGDDTYNIDASMLGGTNNFSGNGGNDTFNVNLTAAAGVTAPLTINGDVHDAGGGRDEVEVNDLFGSALTAAINYIDAVGMTTLTGVGSTVTMNTVETIDFDGDGANDDTVTVNGTATEDDLISVAPIDANRAIVFNGGNPFDGPPEVFATSLPGVAGGSAIPDLDLAGLANATGLNIQDPAGAADALYIYGQSATPLDDGNAFDPFGFGPGDVLPGVGDPAANDVITASDTATTVNGFVVVNYDAVDFAQADPLTQPSVIINAGEEANPATPPADADADNITLTLSPAYRFQVNGGNPDPVGTGVVPPAGDQLNVPGMFATINVYSNKVAAGLTPIVNFDFPGSGMQGFGYSSIEELGTFSAQTVNLVGDNNIGGNDQNDNFVVVGQDVDDFAVPAFPGNVVDGGVGEFVLNINGSLPIRFREVQFLNAFGDDQNPPPGTPSAGNDIDTLEITPYADDTPQGWGIDVSFNEGLPAGADGDQADLLIYNTALFGGQVSENIVVRPAGPDNGELVVTNGSFGTPIVDIDYVANTDIIVRDNDGFLNDTDTLTLLGTNPDNPSTSGNETIVADFTNAGDAANPLVTVNDGATILYRVRDIDNIDALSFDLLDGNDTITVFGNSNAASTPAGNPALNLDALTVRGGAGNDSLILDNTNGLSTMSGGITYEGGTGQDQLQLIGTTAILSSTYDIGPTVDAGTITHSLAGGSQVVHFTGLEPVIDLVPAATLTINATAADNAITYSQSEINAAWGKVSIDAFEPIHFANKTALTINAAGGSDAISLNNPIVPAALTSITVNGGDPSTDSDAVEILGTAADDTFAYTPTAANGGTVVQGGAIAMTYTLVTVESLAIDAIGQAATDALTVTTTNATITPGGDPGTGSVDPVSATGAPLLSATYADMESATVTGTTAVIQGTDENDTITVSAAGVVTVTNELGFNNTVDVSGFNAVVINALGGDDSITIEGGAAFAGGISVLGGDNGTSSDELNLIGAAATVENVSIAPAAILSQQAITGLGSAITADGVERITYVGADTDDSLTVNTGTGDDVARVESADVLGTDRVLSDSLPEVQFSAIDTFTLDQLVGLNTATFALAALSGATATNYQVRSSLADTVIVEGFDGTAADALTVTNPAVGNFAVTESSGNVLTELESNARLELRTQGGDDTVTVDVNGTALIAAPILFDGGSGSDVLVVTGDATGGITDTVYTPGADVTEGRLTYDATMSIDFANLEPVQDNVVSANLTVNGTNAANAISYTNGLGGGIFAGATGLVSVDGYETIEFNNKTTLILNGDGGSDEFSMNAPNAAAQLTGITVNGGDPTASDRVIVNGTAGVDAIRVDTLSGDGAVVTGAQPVPVTLATAEHLVINGQGGDDDLTVETPAGNDEVEFFPGIAEDSGDIIVTRGGGGLNALLPISFLDLGALADITIDDAGAARTDKLVVYGTDNNDNFSVATNGDVQVVKPSSFFVTNNIQTPGVDDVRLLGLDGDDTFNIAGDHPFDRIAVEGGNPDSGSDVLNFNGAGAAVTVNLGNQTVAEAGSGTVAYSGIETINADAGGVGIEVVATGEDDDLTVTVLDANSGNIEHGYTMNRLGQPISAAATPLVHYTNTGGNAVNVNLADGEADTLNVVGNALAQTFNVDVATSTVAIDDGPVVGNDGTVTYLNVNSLGVFGLEGDDTFDVTPGAIPVFIDGGDPIGESAGDTINTNAGGNPVVFEAGPENDEGGILVAGSARISYDHIEALGAIAAMKALIIGTNGDDDITVIARDASTHAGADGYQDFTVSVNDGPAILFLDTPELYIDALAGDDDIVLRSPAPNDASWDVELFVSGGAPSDGAPNEGDRLVLETPGNDTIIYTPTGSDTGTILIDEDNDGINDGVNGGLDSLITIGQFVCPVLDYTSDPGGVELFEYDGEGANDSLTIVAAQGDDTIVHTPGGGFDEGTLRVNTTLGIDYQNLGAAAVLTVADTGGNDTLVANGTASDDAFDVAATTGAVSLVTPSAAHLVLNQTQIENLTLDGLDGNDDFVLNGSQPYDNINVRGGGPGGSDVLTVNGAAATDETFTVDPAFDRGDGTVSVNALLVPYVGIEHVLLEANGGDNDDLVINDDSADNRWTVDAGPVFGDRVQIDDRESIDFDGFNDVTLENGFGTDQFDVYPTQLLGFDGNFTVNGDAAGGAEPVDDVLNIFGTPGDDVITSTASVITTNGVEITPGTNLVEVSVQGLSGDDSITLALALPGVRKVVDGGAGDDNIDVSTMQDALIFGGLGDDIIVGSPLADLIFGGSGNDTISGLGGDDTIYGGDGNDTITGGTGDDSLFGGADSDLLIWNNGHNSDLMEGGTGNDRVQVNGAGIAAAGENYVISANGSRVDLQRTNLVPFTLDIAQVEQLDLNTDSSADDSEVVTVNSLVGTEIEVLNLDAGADVNNQFILNGNDSAETISIGPDEQILGLGPVINTSVVVGGAFSDTITINAAGGEDTITVTDAVDADLVLNGGLGDDVIDASLQPAGSLLTINGDAGDDLLRGGAGDDTINGGDGEDTIVGGAGADTIDGGGDFDTILIEGTAGADTIDVFQAAPTTLNHTVNGDAQVDTLVASTIEEARVVAGNGADTIRVNWLDAHGVNAAIDSVRMTVEGGEDGTSDRLFVVDDGTDDLLLYRKGQDDDSGTVQVGPGNAEPLLNVFMGIENIDFIDENGVSITNDPAGPQLTVFKHDPFESNDDRFTATYLGSGDTINVDPSIDPGPLTDPFGDGQNLSGDSDYYRVVAEASGTLDFQVYFRQIGALASGRPGLPNDGNLDINVRDAAGNIIAGFGVNDADDDERVRIPAVEGQTYYLEIFGNGGNAINVYNFTVVNHAPPVPFDLELKDAPIDGTPNPPGTSTNSDTGRSQFDNQTYDNTPTLYFRLDDGIFLNDLPGNPAPDTPPDQNIPIPFQAGPAQPVAPGYAIAIFDEGDTPPQTGTPVQTPLGFATAVPGQQGIYTFTVPAAMALSEGSHFLTARVQLIDPANPQQTGFGERSQSLEIIVDRTPPPASFGEAGIVGDGLHPDSDSGSPLMPSTFTDNITNDLTPTFYGRAEADAIIRAYVDLTGNGLTADDVFIGQTVATPLDGSNQEPDGYWELTSNIGMNDPDRFGALGLDGQRTILIQAEDVAGNITPDAIELTLDIFIDTSGPQVTNVFITDREDFDIFTLKPDNVDQGPTPAVNSLTINIQDFPARVMDFLYPALKHDLPFGLIKLVGDHSGIIPFAAIPTFTSDPLAAGNPATGYITLTFDEPLPDDRYSLILDDGLVDPAGNALDGESNADEPTGAPLFPSGDLVPGGDFIARFTVDSRPEVATWSQELVYVDINGNFVWDPEGQDNDATNRDFVYHFGTTADAYFAGNFAATGAATASGFDKMGTFGHFNGIYEFFLDTDDDGIGDTVGPMFYQVSVIPVAGDFNAAHPGDEIGGFDGQNWYLDTNGNNRIDAGEQFPSDLRGIPVVGDFNGDGNDDLATFNNATGEFQFDLDRDGDVDDTLTFSFSGFGEKPVAGDVNLDGIDDIVLWVPNRDGQLPENAGEFHYLVSDNPAALPSNVFDDYSPAPLGNDLIAQFGDEFALPILGNFDPPIGDIEPLDTTGWFTNLNDSLDVDNDGTVDPYDALLVINALNRGITSADPSQALRVRNAFDGHFLDVDGNAVIEPFDVIQIINELNRRGRSGQGEAASDSAAAYAAAVDSVFSSDEDEDDLLLDFADNDALRNTL